MRTEFVSVRANALISRAGETPACVHTLRRGWAMQVAHLSDGRRQILHFFVPGDLLNVEALLLGERAQDASIRALTEADLCSFPVESARTLFDASPAQRESLLDYTRAYIAGLSRRLADIGQRSAQGRMAQLLLELWERLRARALVTDDSFEMPVRQEHLADALGMTPVHVNRTLGALRAAGIIGFDRKTMHVLDGARLRKVAEDE
ncbi:MAG: Crp/Fnr family transcriptional regulator [Caulobacterales bacterium]|nr:Crp/Fnr family transcriptional regulator [Caulobacterales bacterium]